MSLTLLSSLYLEPELQKVYDAASAAHARFNAIDKGGLAPYHWHLARVAIRLGPNASIEEKKAALCHDLLEDTDITLDDLVNLGLSTQAISAVQLCSNIYYKNTTHKLWMAAIAQDPNVWGKKVKLADLSDNHSFERMLGLEAAFQQQRAQNAQLSTSKKPMTLNLSQKAFKQADKSMKKKSHAGLWERYLKDMDILLSYGDNAWASDMNIGTFGRYEEYRALYAYLGSKEFLEYQQKQKVHGLRVVCDIELLKDRAGQNYLAAKVPHEISRLYQQSLGALVPESEHLIAQQKNRDGDKNHITLLSAQEFGKTMRFGSLENKAAIEKKISTQEVFDFYTIGTIKETMTPKNSAIPVDNQVFYALCENGAAQTLRRQLGYADKELHATLGFKHKDIFNQKKDMSSKACSFSLVWNTLTHELEREQKLEYGLGPTKSKP